MIDSSKPKKILIATPLYPPAIGGPSQYAKNLEGVWKSEGHQVSVVNFGEVLKLPTGIRHLVYFSRLCRSAWGADFILILDTFSVALPAVIVGKIFFKKTIIRTGGDFLWEGYVERTGDLVLFKDFYQQCRSKFNLKERVVYFLTKFILRAASILVFSTDWQKDIFIEAYGLQNKKITVIENYFGSKEPSVRAERKVFLAATRPLKWKNHDRLKQAFPLVKEVYPSAILDDESLPYDQFLEKLKKCYAVVLVSLGDISPNLILDAIRFNKPFVLTTENGLEARLSGVGLRADPENVKDIASNIINLLNEPAHLMVEDSVKKFNFTHSWQQIGDEFLALA